MFIKNVDLLIKSEQILISKSVTDFFYQQIVNNEMFNTAHNKISFNVIA